MLVCLVDLTNGNCGFKLAGLKQIWLPTITETETEIDFCKELKRPLMSRDFFTNKEKSDF